MSGYYEHKKPDMSRRAIGNTGEDIACRYLEKSGYRILTRNYTVRGGEIDIAAVSPCGRQIVFVEVKTRCGTGFGRGSEAVDKRKIDRLCRAAERYLYESKDKGTASLTPCFDVVEIYINKGSNIRETQKIMLNKKKNIDIN